MTESVASYTIPDEIDEELNNILYVDDEGSNLRIFDSVFSRYYNVFTAQSGHLAIKLLRQYDIHMIITDQKMPEMTGTDLLEQILEEFPDIIRIILTGFADIQAIIKAINKCSIYKYITKPYENTEMRSVIDKGLEIYNNRKKKYSELGLNGQSKKVGSEAPGTQDNQTALSDSLLRHYATDAMPQTAEFEAFFDHHVYYAKDQEALPHVYYDFTINDDEDSSKLYFLVANFSDSKTGALTFLHMKHRFRKLLEYEGNEVTLLRLRDYLTNFYEDLDSDVGRIDLTIIAYDYLSQKVEMLSKNDQARFYRVSEQLENIKLSRVSEESGGYTYRAENTDYPVMVYFYEANGLKVEDSVEFSSNINQIINNATNSPFDLQSTLISSGINSVAKELKDIKFFGIHLNELNYEN